MFLSPRWEGDLEREMIAPLVRTVLWQKKGYLTLLIGRPFPGKRGRACTQDLDQGGPNPILQQSPLLGEKKRCQFVSFLNSRIERTSLTKRNRPRPLNQVGVPGIS